MSSHLRCSAFVVQNPLPLGEGRVRGSYLFPVASVFFVMLLFVGSVRAFGQDTIERRGAEPALEGEITTIDDNGVTIRSESNAVQTVTWDHIRSVQSRRAQPGLEKRIELAEDIWRARSRLERGDAALAEPLFVRLFEQYRGKKHEIALVVAEGLLRCRLARLDHEGAVIPALEVMRMRRAGVTMRAYSMLPDAVDSTTGLCMKLAPAWADRRAVTALERLLSSYDSAGDQVVTAVAREYRRAARQQLELEVIESPKDSTDVNGHEGVQIMRMMVDAGVAEASDRQGARNKLLQRMDHLPTWAQAWARYAVGASQLKEKSIDQQLEAMVQLLYLPAEDRQGEQNYLAGLALAQVIETLKKQGNQRGAESLLAELKQHYGTHPALLEHIYQTASDI